MIDSNDIMVFIDLKQHDKDGACGWEKNIANRFKYLKVSMCENTRYCTYHNENGNRHIKVSSEEAYFNCTGNKILLDSCSDFNEVKKYVK
jgi:hypothetical protein